MNVRTITAVALLILPCARGVAAPTLEALRAAFDKDVSRIESDNIGDRNDLLAGYEKALDKTMEDVSERDQRRAAKEEMARFKRNRTVPYPPNEALPEAVKKLQAQYRTALRKVETEKGRQCLALTAEYLAALDKFIKLHSEDETLDLIVTATKERERVKGIADSLQAQMKQIFADARAEEAAVSQPEPEKRQHPSRRWGGRMRKR